MLAYNFYTKKTWTPLLLDQKNQGGPEPLQGGRWTPPNGATDHRLINVYRYPRLVAESVHDILFACVATNMCYPKHVLPQM